MIQREIVEAKASATLLIYRLEQLKPRLIALFEVEWFDHVCLVCTDWQETRPGSKRQACSIFEFSSYSKRAARGQVVEARHKRGSDGTAGWSVWLTL